MRTSSPGDVLLNSSRNCATIGETIQPETPDTNISTANVLANIVRTPLMRHCCAGRLPARDRMKHHKQGNPSAEPRPHQTRCPPELS